MLGLVASYRSLGNGEIVVKSIADRMGQDWRLFLVRLPKLSILPCKGCFACLLPGEHCRLGDDLDWLLERINESDVVIFSAPNYAMGPVGIVKMIADRAIQASGYHPEFSRKRTAVALTLGREEYRGYADTALVSQVAALGLDVVSLECFYGMYPGEVALAEDFEDRTGQVARVLTSPNYEREVPAERCPSCFSDLFRMHPDGLECATCKALARREGNSLKFFRFHPEFTEAGRARHLKWALTRKEEYETIRDRLKTVQEEYRGGRWICPPNPELGRDDQ